MHPEISTWRVQQIFTASLVRSFLLAGFCVAATCSFLIMSRKFDEHGLWLNLTLLLSVFLPLAFAKKYYTFRKLVHFITLDEKFLVVPTAMMGVRKTDVENIKSLETIHCFKKARGLVIGMADGSSSFIDAGLFDSYASFDDFSQKLTSCVTRRNRHIFQIERMEHHQKTIMFFTTAIILVYAVSAWPEWQEIRPESIEAGALTKTSWQFSKLYRIASSFFLHLNVNHLLLNIICLAVIGKNIDAILGKFRFAGIIFGSALAGSLLSLAYAKSEYVVGASGGIMGLLSAYAVICLKYQRCIPGSVSTSAKKIVAMLFLQLVLDFTMEGVDILSHVGGVLYGATYAVFLLRERQPHEIAMPSHMELAIAVSFGSLYLIGLICFLFNRF